MATELSDVLQLTFWLSALAGVMVAMISLVSPTFSVTDLGITATPVTATFCGSGSAFFLQPVPASSKAHSEIIRAFFIRLRFDFITKKWKKPSNINSSCYHLRILQWDLLNLQ